MINIPTIGSAIMFCDKKRRPVITLGTPFAVIDSLLRKHR